MVMLAMMVAIGVVISPILRIEGMCPTAHLINIVCSVLLGPWYSLLCATLIGIIRMMFMGIPPLALTGAVFGAFLSGVFYRASHGKIICAVIGEIFGTGIIGSLVSYPVMAFLMGRSGLNAFFYTPMFLAATCMGGTIAYFFLKALSHAGMLARAAQPLIHCITNPISIHDCANIILAAGGRPIMAEHPAEVAEITRNSHALALNLGNITDARMKSMPESLKIAASLHIPVMLDLVGTACSNLRYEFAQKLMNIHMPELLKGNMSELLAMSGQTAHAIGIDAGVQDVLTDANRSHLKELFQEKASRWNTTLLITGKEDMIVSASKCEFITNGTPAMSQITGTGCMLGMICATYLAVTDPFTAALSAAREFGTAGERAEKNSSGPGSFQTELFDQFYNLL